MDEFNLSLDSVDLSATLSLSPADAVAAAVEPKVVASRRAASRQQRSRSRVRRRRRSSRKSGGRHRRRKGHSSSSASLSGVDADTGLKAAPKARSKQRRSDSSPTISADLDADYVSKPRTLERAPFPPEPPVMVPPPPPAPQNSLDPGSTVTLDSQVPFVPICPPGNSQGMFNAAGTVTRTPPPPPPPSGGRLIGGHIVPLPPKPPSKPKAGLIANGPAPALFVEKPGLSAPGMTPSSSMRRPLGSASDTPRTPFPHMPPPSWGSMAGEGAQTPRMGVPEPAAVATPAPPPSPRLAHEVHAASSLTTALEHLMTNRTPNPNGAAEGRDEDARPQLVPLPPPSPRVSEVVRSSSGSAGFLGEHQEASAALAPTLHQPTQQPAGPVQFLAPIGTDKSLPWNKLSARPRRIQVQDRVPHSAGHGNGSLHEPRQAHRRKRQRASDLALCCFG